MEETNHRATQEKYRISIIQIKKTGLSSGFFSIMFLNDRVLQDHEHDHDQSLLDSLRELRGCFL